MTASSVATVETTSTSFMIAAGLKKCMPMTSCGRLVTLAIEMIGSEEVVVARMAPGLQISSRFSKSVVLIGEVLGDRLDDEVDVPEVVERGGAAHPAEHLGLLLLGGPAALDLLVEVLRDGGDDAVDLVLAATGEEHVVAGLGEDLDDAGGHRAGADDADEPDVVAQLRLVVGARGVRVVDHHDGLSGAS